MGADGTWSGSTGTQAWSDSANWLSGSIPGATSGTTNSDTATFNSASTGTFVTIDAGRIVKNISFGASAGWFTLGDSTANTGSALNLSSGGNITLQNGYAATAAATGNLIDAPLVLEPASTSTAGTYTFNNSALSGADTVAATPKLNIAGNISGGTTSSTITLTLAGTVGTRNAANAAGALNAANTISGIISNGGATGGLGITINGTNSTAARINAWNLTGLNTYSGPTTITSGVLYFNSIADTGTASALGSGSNGTIALGGGFLIYDGGTASSNRTITGSGGSLYNNGTGTLTLTGTITNSSIALRGTSPITVDGRITGGTLIKTNGNLLTLTNASNAFTSLSISAGIVSVNSISNGGTPSALGQSTSILMGQNQTGDNVGTLRFTGANGGSTDRTIILQAGSANTVAAPATGVLESATADQTLSLSGNLRSNGTDAAYFGAVELAGVGNGVYSGIIGGLTATGQNATPTNFKVTKTGTGTWEVSAANIYYGVTTVTAGKLLVSGSLNGTSNVSVAASATLGGNGTIRPGNGAITNISSTAQVNVAANGILAPGGTGTTGTLKIDSSTSTVANILNFAPNAKIQLRLDSGNQSDRISLLNGSANDILFGGNNVIDFTDLTGGNLAPGLYTLFTADTADAYSGLTLSGQTITGGLQIGNGLSAYASSSLLLSGNDIVLQVIPEPGSMALLLGGLGLLGGRLRRRASARRIDAAS